MIPSTASSAAWRGDLQGVNQLREATLADLGHAATMHETIVTLEPAIEREGVMKRILLIAAALVAILAALGIGAVVFLTPPEIDLTPYEPLREPRISTRAPDRVLEVVLEGAARETAGAAIGALFRRRYSLEGAHEFAPAAPKARWPLDESTPEGQWVGRFALAVPESVTSIPESRGDPEVRLATWEYGDVAEILHVGPYDREKPTIERLKAYVKEAGYEISGEHEEEYLRGPGLLSAGDPAQYYTIIRYPVTRKPPASPEPSAEP